MSTRQSILLSTLGKKILISLSGLLMVFFLVEHLAGNLLLLPDSGPFNLYAHRLISLGWPIIAAERQSAGSGEPMSSVLLVLAARVRCNGENCSRLLHFYTHLVTEPT